MAEVELPRLGGLLAGLELDYFGEEVSIRSHETNSEIKALVLTMCYGRGISKADIMIPRLPRNIPINVVEPDIRDLLPTRKRAGRGRARALSQQTPHMSDSNIAKPGVTMCALPRKVPFCPDKRVPPKPSLFELGTFCVEDKLEIYMSEDEDGDEGYGGVPCMLLPSQRGIVSHPFGLPPKSKFYDMKNCNEFPTLSTIDDQDGDVTASNVTKDGNAVNRRTGFPGLPPRMSSKTVSNFDIVFKPMKERKSKKKQRKVKCVSNDDATDVNAMSVNAVVVADNNEVSQDVDEGSGHRHLRGVDGLPNCRHPEIELSADDNFAVELIHQDQFVDELSSHGEHPAVELPACGRSSPADGSVWRLDGAGVIQIDGVPYQEDVGGLTDVVSSFGTVVDYERKELPDILGSMRFKYSSSDSCSWAVSCLHDSDLIFPDSGSVLQCYVIGDMEGREYDEVLAFE